MFFLIGKCSIVVYSLMLCYTHLFGAPRILPRGAGGGLEEGLGAQLSSVPWGSGMGFYRQQHLPHLASCCRLSPPHPTCCQLQHSSASCDASSITLTQEKSENSAAGLVSWGNLGISEARAWTGEGSLVAGKWTWDARAGGHRGSRRILSTLLALLWERDVLAEWQLHFLMFVKQMSCPQTFCVIESHTYKSNTL